MAGRQLRVAMVAACPFPANRGTPSRVKGMAEALARRGHKIDLFTYHHGLNLEVEGVEIYRNPRLPYHYLGPGPTFTKLMVLDPLLAVLLARKLRAERYDVIHAHHFEGALISYLANKGVGTPVIYDAHTRLDKELESYRFPNSRALSRTLDYKVPHWADRVIAVSDSLRRTLIEDGIDPGKVDVIVTGADLTVFDDVESDSLRRDLGLEDRKVVVYSGSLDEFQQVDLLVEAMARVVEKEPRATLLVVTAFDRPAFRQVIDRCGIGDHVSFNIEPAFSNVPRYLAAADVAVLPRVECPGIPQKLVNYMGAGKAIVSFAGSAKLLTHEVDALVVENGDTEELAAGVLRCLADSNLRQRLGENARRKVRGTYDWANLVESIEAIYSSLLDPGERSPWRDRRS